MNSENRNDDARAGRLSAYGLGIALALFGLQASAQIPRTEETLAKATKALQNCVQENLDKSDDAAPVETVSAQIAEACSLDAEIFTGAQMEHAKNQSEYQSLPDDASKQAYMEAMQKKYEDEFAHSSDFYRQTIAKHRAAR